MSRYRHPCRNLGMTAIATLLVTAAGCDDQPDSAPGSAATVTPPITISTVSQASRDPGDAETLALSDLRIGEAVQQELIVDDGVPQHRNEADAGYYKALTQRLKGDAELFDIHQHKEKS